MMAISAEPLVFKTIKVRSHLTMRTAFSGRWFAPLLLVLALVVPAMGAQVRWQQLKAFGFSEQRGTTPNGNLIQGSDGTLYGTSSADGGAVFKVNPDGTSYGLLHAFGQTTADGNTTQSGVIEASDGALYGTTSAGGSNNSGTVYRLNKDGTGYTILHYFQNNNIDGWYPKSELLEGSDGLLYGTTSYGGTNHSGTIFRLCKDGSAYSVLHSFLGWTGGESGNPGGPLIEGASGMLFGTSMSGGKTGNSGTVFKLNKDGTGYTILHTFIGPGGDGLSPVAGLLKGTGGALYGVCGDGGTNGWPGWGAIFTLKEDGTGYHLLHSFNYTDGYGASGQLCFGPDGALYGAAPYGGIIPYTGASGGGVIFRLETSGANFSLLYNFSSSSAAGFRPAGGLMRGQDGALYGATSLGGTSGLGTLFKLNQNGTGFAFIRNFVGAAGGDGTHPQAELLQAKDGKLYGTTYDGGITNAGTVFAVNRDGSDYRVLFSFLGYAQRDGEYPNDGLTEGKDGALYGTTYFGGTDPDGAGSVFTIRKDGSGYKVLHNCVNNGTDVAFPMCGLVAASDGRLYGTATGGQGWGAVFGLYTDGSGYAVIHSFDKSGEEGAEPRARVIEGSDGALYGTTYYGGTYGFNAGGTVFRLSKDGSSFTILHNLSGNGGEGCRPQATLLEGSDGALYGTASTGDFTSYWGTVFKLGKDGSGFQVLHSFGIPKGDGVMPTSGLVEGRDGALYGTTAYGGSANLGTVFTINKDGSGYLVLRSLGAINGDGTQPGGLALGSDGAFYLTTYHGGGMNFGALQRLLPPQMPDGLGLTSMAGSIRVQFSGTAGQKYQILSSPDLGRWSVLETLTMPAGGLYTSIVPISATGSAYYRAAWVP